MQSQGFAKPLAAVCSALANTFIGVCGSSGVLIVECNAYFFFIITIWVVCFGNSRTERGTIIQAYPSQRRPSITCVIYPRIIFTAENHIPGAVCAGANAGKINSQFL